MALLGKQVNKVALKQVSGKKQEKSASQKIQKRGVQRIKRVTDPNVEIRKRAINHKAEKLRSSRRKEYLKLPIEEFLMGCVSKNPINHPSWDADFVAAEIQVTSLINSMSGKTTVGALAFSLVSRAVDLVNSAY